MQHFLPLQLHKVQLLYHLKILNGSYKITSATNAADYCIWKTTFLKYLFFNFFANNRLSVLNNPRKWMGTNCRTTAAKNWITAPALSTDVHASLRTPFLPVPSTHETTFAPKVLLYNINMLFLNVIYSHMTLYRSENFVQHAAVAIK